ncbi:uncharacterized protein LOC121235454 [Juglans microcarpa x Juglans regia]|uniref:uncharacterized protein LOC121235454 n=1 Tax=Juglans microcarpa x Juglans regia TaxID=2249226 RepID=UPI001B7E7506|nr:uncharacterized protein LOC121235454 [Juglans microcarpa x Juglans regia]
MDKYEEMARKMGASSLVDQLLTRPSLPLTLKGATRVWFKSLAPGSVNSFGELAHLFLMQFMTNRRRRCPSMYLLTVKQREDEILKAYLARFNKERMTTDDQDKQITLATLLGDIWPLNQFMAELAGRTSTTLREFMDHADGIINAEGTLQALIEPRKMELEQADRKAKALGKANAPEKARKG